MQRRFLSLFVCALRRTDKASCCVAVDTHRATRLVHPSSTSPTHFPSAMHSALLAHARLAGSNRLVHLRTMNPEGFGMNVSYNTHCVCPRDSTA